MHIDFQSALVMNEPYTRKNASARTVGRTSIKITFLKSAESVYSDDQARQKSKTLHCKALNKNIYNSDIRRRGIGPDQL